jgi:hypothetical protein
MCGSYRRGAWASPSGDGLDTVQLARLLGRDESDLDEVERADESVAEPVTACAGDRVAQRHRPVVLEQDQRRRGVVWDLLDHIPGVVAREHADAVGRRFSASFGAGLHAFLAFDAETDQRADLAAELDRLVLGEVAQMRHLDLSVGVLVNRERVDDTHRVARLQTLRSAMISP